MTTLEKNDIKVMKIIHESNNGGIVSDCNFLPMAERKMLIRYLMKGGQCLPNCPSCD